MTQQADPRLPLIDSSVDAGTTTPGTGTPSVQTAGWPPTAPEPAAAPLSPPVGFGPMPQGGMPQGGMPQGGMPQGGMPQGGMPQGGMPQGGMPQGPMAPMAPMPQGAQAPLNTLAWVSVVVAFFVSPVAIVLGILARKQVARTGERGRGLATLGAVLGSVFTVIGIATTVIVLALATQVTAAIQAAGPAPGVDTGAPAPVPSVVTVPSAAPSSDDFTAGQAQLLTGFIQVGAAADTMSTDIQSHRGDLDAMQNDFSAYRDAVARFRTTATTATLAPDVRQRVDADLVPAIDRTLADLDALSTTRNQSRLSDAADRLQTDSQAMVTAATAAVGG
jgi:uncharacterized protein DUF4190